ncbi:MAG: uncharacterized membrane protein YhaH (DUF805 family) [Bacteroidia bacterium]|jgi:uncharacterized membrane protein YhaH (DUF805 family)
MEPKKNIFQHFWEVVTKNYVNFNGRARRMEYWSFLLVKFLIGIVLGLFNFVTMDLLGTTGMIGSMFNLSNILAIALLVPTLAVSVRRFHDTDKSGAVPIILNVCGFIYGLSAVYFISQMSGLMDRSDVGLLMGIVGTFAVILITLAIYALIVSFTDGTHGPNKFGPDPKQPNLGDELEQIGVE